MAADPVDRNSKALIKKLEHARTVGAHMSSGTRVRSGIFEAVTDDTIICRCEEVCFSDIRAAVKEGAKDVNDIKRRTRLGMGHCQGRFCGPKSRGTFFRDGSILLDHRAVQVAVFF